MFGIGLFEILVIALAALIFLGTGRLPEVARQLGRYFVQFRRITSDVRSSVEEALRKAEHDLLEEERAKIKKLLSDQPAVNTNQSIIEDPLSPDHSELALSEDLENAQNQPKKISWGESEKAKANDQTSE